MMIVVASQASVPSDSGASVGTRQTVTSRPSTDGAHARLRARSPASRDASAMIVSAGFAAPCVGMTLPSAT